MATNITLIRPKPTWERRGRSRSSHYKDISDGLFPPAVPIGDRAVGTPWHEIDAVIAAQISGQSKEKIRGLVKKLVAERKVLFDKWQS